MTDATPDRIAGLVITAAENTVVGALTYSLRIAGKDVKLTIDVVNPEAAPSKATLGALNGTGIQSGVSMFTGEGFCTIRAEGNVDGKDVLLRGQLSPEEVRQFGLSWLAAAEAAASDAAVLATFRRLGLPDEGLGAFLTELRDQRFMAGSSDL